METLKSNQSPNFPLFLLFFKKIMKYIYLYFLFFAIVLLCYTSKRERPARVKPMGIFIDDSPLDFHPFENTS
ncbi:hypothetical protein K502DRAFT_67811 [Neoconidiobolus thromboides FSU 785]|nr:hypothetical protein K502DRAFT_67811 [Neoconidiobolus thromboides FSU 785]